MVGAIGLVSFAQRPADAAVYWGNGSNIGAANLDGSAPQFDWLTPLPNEGGGGHVCGVAVNATHLLWLGTFTAGRTSLDAAPVPQTFMAGLNQPCGITLDATHVYWGNPKQGTIGRAGVDGGDVNPAFISGVEPCAIAVDDAYVYWSDKGTAGIGRARLDGTEVDRGFFFPGSLVCGVAVDDRYVYWGNQTSNGAIGRANLDGSAANANFIPSVGAVWSIAVDPAHLYWNVQAQPWGWLGRANRDGTGVIRSWITGTSSSPSGIAVDARPTPPPRLIRPSRPISFGTVRHNVRKGTVDLKVDIPGLGELAVTSPKVGWKVIKPPNPKSPTWRLKLWPGKKGRDAARIRRQLRLRGRAPVTLRVSFEEVGKSPTETTRRLAFKKQKPKPRRAKRTGHTRRPPR